MLKDFKLVELLNTKGGIRLSIDLNGSLNGNVFELSNTKLIIEKRSTDPNSGFLFTEASREFSMSELYRSLLPMIVEGDIKIIQFKEFSINEVDTRAIKYFLVNTDIPNLIMNSIKLAIKLESEND